MGHEQRCRTKLAELVPLLSYRKWLIASLVAVAVGVGCKPVTQLPKSPISATSDVAVGGEATLLPSLDGGYLLYLRRVNPSDVTSPFGIVDTRTRRVFVPVVPQAIHADLIQFSKVSFQYFRWNEEGYATYEKTGGGVLVVNALAKTVREGNRNDVSPSAAYIKDYARIQKIAKALPVRSTDWVNRIDVTGSIVAYHDIDRQRLMIASLTDTLQVYRCSSNESVSWVDLSPDGKWLAWTSYVDPQRLGATRDMLNITNLSTMQTYSDDPTVGVSNTAWSPDSKKVYYARRDSFSGPGSIFVVDIADLDQ